MKKKQSTSLIVKAIMLLLAFIVMVFVVSLAWFSRTSTPVHGTGVSAKTSGIVTFDIAVGFKTSANGYKYTMSQYSKQFNLRDVVTPEGEHFDALHDFSPIDVTGNGVKLIRPSMLTKNTDIDRTSSTYTTVTPNKEYISFDMYFKADEPCKVYLDENSFVKGAVEEEAGDGNLIVTQDPDNSKRKSNDGDFSKDAVVGAVRVAFVNYESFTEGETTDLKNEARLLWLPRPDIHLNSDGEKGSWTLSTNVQPGGIYDRFLDNDRYLYSTCDTYTHHYYAFLYDESSNTYVGTDLNYGNTVTDPSRIAVCDVSEKVGDYYYGKTQVNIWIEGCDAEARRTIAGGMFQVNFDLAGGK